MTECSASVAGGKEILLFCEKVTKDDIEVRFYQEVNGQIMWEGYGEFQPSDVHKQYGICFRTPRFLNLETEENIPVKIQLRRPSDGAVSDPRPFQFTPIDGGRSFWAAKRMKTNYSLFNAILTTDRTNEELKRKIPMAASMSASAAGSITVSPLASPDSSTAAGSHGILHHVVVPVPKNSSGQMTQPIQLVHAAPFPPPPSPLKSVTCPTPELPPPPTPLPPAEECEVRVPPKAAHINLHSISNANLALMPSEPLPFEAEVKPALEISDSYEDIGQALYDDVDTKYDAMDFSNEPPQPPVRKRPQSQNVNTIPPTPIEEPSRPLPDTPSKRPSLISKFKSKSKKGKEEEPPTPVAPGENGNRPAASLFQRLFHRSKSVDPKSQGPPAIPPHRDDNGNESNNLDEIQIQDFIDEGNLDNLDNMVTEIAQEYMNESSLDATASSTYENNGNIVKT